MEPGDDPTEESEEITKFRKTRIRQKTHDLLIQEYLVQQEERMAQQGERVENFQQRQLKKLTTI